MTRDYKPTARTRKARSSGSGSSLLVGILIGLLLGLGIALAVAIYLNRVPDAFVSRGKSTEPAAATKADPAATQASPKAAPQAKLEEKPRFDFYNILPGEDQAKGKSAKESPRPPAAEAKESFYLQAGAFQNAADAENMKARLALLGIEASIQPAASAERGPLHRVRVGPFNRVEDVNRARDTLKQNGIETTLIKGREPSS